MTDKKTTSGHDIMITASAKAVKAEPQEENGSDEKRGERKRTVRKRQITEQCLVLSQLRPSRHYLNRSAYSSLSS
jgi:hypothetical protein